MLAVGAQLPAAVLIELELEARVSAATASNAQMDPTDLVLTTSLLSPERTRRG
jgi:hypothetical protein